MYCIPDVIKPYEFAGDFAAAVNERDYFAIKQYGRSNQPYGYHKESALHAMMMCKNVDTKMIDILVNECDVNPNAITKVGSTALHIAVLEGQKLEIIKYLVEKLKIDPKRKNQFGTTAIDFAKKFIRNQEIVKYFSQFE